MTFIIIFFICRMVRALIRKLWVQRILRKSGVEQSERTRVSEGKICGNVVKQITCPRNSKIQDKSRRRHHIKRLLMESFLLFAFISLQIIVNKNRYGRTANPPSYGQAKRRSRQILRPHTDKTIV